MTLLIATTIISTLGRRYRRSRSELHRNELEAIVEHSLLREYSEVTACIDYDNLQEKLLCFMTSLIKNEHKFF